MLCKKEEARIIDISPNSQYYGADYLQPSSTLNYWGYDPENEANNTENTDMDIDNFLDTVELSDDKTMQCSHEITIEYLDSGASEKISTLGDVLELVHSYVMTVHKAQGAEWERVFCFFHHSHACMLQRELLYTAVTRAKEDLIIICEDNTFFKGIISQKIKGDTLEQKAEYFKGKIDSNKELVIL